MATERLTMRRTAKDARDWDERRNAAMKVENRMLRKAPK